MSKFFSLCVATAAGALLTLSIGCQHFVLPAFAPADLTLWYDHPANNSKPMDEALPIGNGTMGGLVFGAPLRERISINEDSLWTGGENPSGDDNTMGAYQVFGNVYVNLPGHTNAGVYRRELNLATAQAGVSYEVGDIRYQREFFAAIPSACSWPGSAPIIRKVTRVPSNWLTRIAAWRS